ncbi:MAG: MATE family efflux transporter [Clostridiaceae bacterium]
METLRRDLTQGSIGRELIRFSMPLLLSYFLQAFYGIADTIIVSFFCDMAEVTAVTQGSQVTNILTSCVSGLAGGGTVLIAQYAGAKDKNDLSETIQTIFTVFVLLALAFTALMLAIDEWCIRALDVPMEARAACKAYLDICLSGTLFVFLYNGIAAALQALGDSRHPLVFVGIACGVNIALDLLLVGGFGLGAAGAAVATVFSQLVSVIVSILFLRKRRFSFDFRFRSFRIHREKAGQLFRLGFPYALQRTIVALSFLAISGLSNSYGLLAATASGIVSKINNIATLPFSAVNVSISAMCGQNLGAGLIARAKKTFYTGLKLTLAVGALIFALVQLFPHAFLAVFSASPELTAVAVPFLRLYSICYLLMPFSYSINALMTGSGHTFATMLSGLCAALILRVPLAYLISKTAGLGFPGIALGSAAAVFGSIFVGLAFFRADLWKKPLLRKKTDIILSEELV